MACATDVLPCLQVLTWPRACLPGDHRASELGDSTYSETQDAEPAALPLWVSDWAAGG